MRVCRAQGGAAGKLRRSFPSAADETKMGWSSRLRIGRGWTNCVPSRFEMSACTLNPFLDPGQALRIPEWYVWVAGGDPVGPVSADQIARGIRAGKVPGDAQVARGCGGQWEEALDASAVREALKAL
jgi:hypothetical protein